MAIKQLKIGFFTPSPGQTYQNLVVQKFKEKGKLQKTRSFYSHQLCKGE